MIDNYSAVTRKNHVLPVEYHRFILEWLHGHNRRITGERRYCRSWQSERQTGMQIAKFL